MSEQKKQRTQSANVDATVKKHKFNKRKGIMAAIIVAVIIVIVGIYFCFAKLFFVKNIEVVDVGDTLFKNPYTEEQLFDGLGIEKGEGLYSFDAGEIEDKAIYSLPYFEKVEISRKWPSTIVVKAVFEQPRFYCEILDDRYIVSENLKVLEYTKDSRKIKLNSLIYLEAPSVHSCVVGEKLGLDENTANIVSELLTKLDENGVLRHVTSINVRDKFGVEIMYGTVYLVKIGDMKNLDAKMHYLTKIIEDRQSDISGGIIDLTNVSKKEAKFDKFS